MTYSFSGLLGSRLVKPLWVLRVSVSFFLFLSLDCVVPSLLTTLGFLSLSFRG